MYIRAREKALVSRNIVSGWKALGLETPGQSPGLELSLLHSSPPDGTELREANAPFNSQKCGVNGVPSLAKRYAERMTRALETTQSELVTLCKDLTAQTELLRTRNARKKW